MNSQIEPMTPEDWPQVRKIYAEGLATGLAAFLNNPPAYTAWDAAHLPFARLVAREPDEILGWAALSPVENT